jgi:hypothetical protein
MRLKVDTVLFYLKEALRRMTFGDDNDTIYSAFF